MDAHEINEDFLFSHTHTGVKNVHRFSDPAQVFVFENAVDGPAFTG